MALFALGSSFVLNDIISSLTFRSMIFAYCCVVLIFLCPSILLTVSMGTPLVSVTVVANVCLAQWKVNSLLIPQTSAISFRLAIHALVAEHRQALPGIFGPWITDISLQDGHRGRQYRNPRWCIGLGPSCKYPFLSINPG